MMFEKITEFVKAEFDLCAASPVLISNGKNNEIDSRLPDTVFLMGSDGENNCFVIPGSTIKGVIRNFIYEEIKYSKCNVDEEALFGKVQQGAQKSRVSFHDAYADMSTVKSTLRYSTAIDPVLGNAKGGSLNNMQTVDKGVFKAGFRLTNYTHAELSVILKALRAVNMGVVRFGGKTSRGFGIMQIENFKLTIYSGYNDDLSPKVKSEYKSLEDCYKEVCRE